MNLTSPTGPVIPPSPVANRWRIGLALALAGLGVLMVLLTFVLWLLNNTGADLSDNLGSLGDLLTALASCVVAGLILWRQPRQPIGWLLLSIGLLWAIEWFGEAYTRYAYMTLGRPLPGAAFFAWLFRLTWVPGFGLLIWLILLFPTGRPLTPRWRWVGMAATLFTLPNSLVDAVLLWPYRGPMLLSEDQAMIEAIYQPVGAFVNTALGMGVLLAFLLLVPATIAMLLRLRRAEGVERAQLKWFALATAFLAATMLLLVVIITLNSWLPAPTTLSAVWELLFLFAPAMLPIAIGIAILRHRLWDIDLIIRRTLVYTTLSVVVILVYTVIVGGIGTLLLSAPVAAMDGATSNRWQAMPLQLLAAGAVAVIFHPMRSWLQGRVNRWLYGEINDPYAVVARLGQQLETTLAPDHLVATIVDTVREALKLPYVRLHVDNSTLQAESVAGNASLVRNPGVAEVKLPLLHQGEHVGDLVLAPRSGETDFSSADRHLLAGLARQAGSAIQAARLTADLQQARQRLVAAREEERRRLRRDLHDALGAALAAIAMQADAARSLVDEAPEESKYLLSEVTAQAQSTLADIRRLIYNLRPPALDDLGLLGALQQLAKSHAQSGVEIVVQAADSLPTLPAAIEVAAYRIVQEALTNVVKHARAHRCVVAIAYTASKAQPSAHTPAPSHAATLTVEVQDDGVGLSANRTAGVGLHSMSERAEEVGGYLHLEPLSTGGTRLLATLPLLS